MTEKHLGEMLIGMGEIQDSDELWWNDKDNNKITKALEELGESGWELTHISQSNDNDWEKNEELSYIYPGVESSLDVLTSFKDDPATRDEFYKICMSMKGHG